MSPRWSFLRAFLVPAAIALGGALGACNSSPNLSQKYTSPGWYLEQPRPLLVAEPIYIAGPMSYDDCESQRLSTKKPELYLCNREIIKPSEVYNPWKAFTPVSSQPAGTGPQPASPSPPSSN